jgi:hypothetical protein
MRNAGFVEKDIETYIRQLENFRHKPQYWDLAVKLTGHIEEAIRILEHPMDSYSRRMTTALRLIKEPIPTSQDVSLGVLEGFVKVEEAKQQQQEVPEVEL